MKDSYSPFDKALTQAVLAQFADIPAQEDDISLSFTPAFEEDVQEYLNYVRQRKRCVGSLSRILAVAAMVGILMLSSALISIGAEVEPVQDGSYIFSRVSVTVGTYFQYEFYVDPEISMIAPDQIRDVYYPTDIPEDFTLLYREATADGAGAAWENEEGKRISYSQALITENKWTRYLDYDPGIDIAGVFTLGDFEVFRLKRRHETIYLWSDHSYCFELRADAEVDEETMKKIFVSIEWIPGEHIF